MLDDLLAGCYAYLCFIIIVLVGHSMTATP